MKLKYSSIQQCCVYYILAWLLAPPLAYGTVFRVFAILFATLWMLVEAFHTRPSDNRSVAKLRQIYHICIMVFSVSLMGSRMLFHDMSLISAFLTDITTYIMFLVGYIASKYVAENRWEELYHIFQFTILLGVVFSLTTIFRNPVYYAITRSAGGEADAAYNALARQAANHGVGGFGFVCFTSVFAPILLYNYLVNKKNKLMLIAFAIMQMEVLSAGYTLALLISITGIGITLFAHTKTLVIRLLIIMNIVCIAFFYDSTVKLLYDGLRNLAGDTMYANKVEDVFAFLIGGSSEGTFYSRQERYLTSLRSMFLDYPVLGSYILAGKRAIGYHSSILDTFAAYGWGIGIVWMYIIVGYPTKVIKVICNDKWMPVVVFVTFILTAMFNTYTMHMGAFYFIVPVMAYGIREQSNG